MRYTNTLDSLKNRPLPQWYLDAKFGIFIHWGIFSIPAFAPHVGTVSDAGKQDYDRSIALSPYTEWYSNSIKVAGTPAAEFHKTNYGEQPYEKFKEAYLEGLEQWDPASWAKSFQQSGAKYVVLVTKHHDGFCLWPTDVENPNQKGWHTKRDVVGELAEAVRAEGLRFGVYYSGGIDWSFNKTPLKTLGDFISSVPRGRYPEYASRQVRELIERYQPSILWNDISWPTDLPSLLSIFAEYYNAVPEGVVNDRWRHYDWVMKLLGTRLGKALFDAMVKRHLKKHPEQTEGVIPPAIPHSDFRTPEYTTFEDIQSKKWEATRGMSHSFAFNRNDTEDDYETSENLILGFIDSVSKNGNLLLNVGPRGCDSKIPVEQLSRLKAFGEWLKGNGDAIYGSSPWVRAEAVTDEGLDVRYTCKEEVLNIIILGTPAGNQCRILDLAIEGPAKLLADEHVVQTVVVGNNLQLTFSRPLTQAVAHVIQMKLPDNLRDSRLPN
jgi:alpha-L-fucosidase